MDRKYQVALSFAGEQRPFVDAVATILRSMGVQVFYDSFAEAEILGEDLYEFFGSIYSSDAHFMVMFWSQEYRDKQWTVHERRSAQTRQVEERGAYILPVRFDSTELPAPLSNLGRLDVRDRTPEEIASLVATKLVSKGLVLSPPISRSSFAHTEAPRDDRKVIVSVLDPAGNVLSGVIVRLISRNGTTLDGFTDEFGQAAIQIPKRGLVSVMCADPRHPSFFLESHDPALDLVVTLPPDSGIGSLISDGGWDHVPGLETAMNPHNAGEEPAWHYLYVRNASVNGKPDHPAHFWLNEEMHIEDAKIEDAKGNESYITFRAIVGQSFLFEFRPVPI